MSNIYIQEPPTSGKVLLKTTAGDIDIELWARECPKACRNFVQLCMEGYYNGTIFHRVVRGFIVQGGDPNGDGTGGESIYGHTFKDEFHSRLRYARRGLVGMANSDADDNASQFFFTMGATPELQNKNTLFGKVTGDTIFNMLKLEEGLVDHNERPMYPQKILRTEILSNPFEDIVPRELKKDEKKDKRRKREKGVKNFGLLSFGEEAEGDEEETNQFVQQNAGKAKSMHDVVDDPKLSKDALKIEDTEGPTDENENEDAVEKESFEDAEQRMRRIKDKLKVKSGAVSSSSSKTQKSEASLKKEDNSESDEDVLMTHEQEKKLQSEKKKEEIRQEIHSLKKQYQTDKKNKDEALEKKIVKDPVKDKSAKAEDNEFIRNFIDEKEKYTSLKSQIPKKGASREDFTLSLLKKFRNKLDTLKQRQNETESEENKVVDVDDKKIEEEIQNDDWLGHTLRFEESAPVLAKDASTKDDDWYDAYDPRNPLNKRKRGGEGRSANKKESRSETSYTKHELFLHREDFTLSLLKKFRNKLDTLKQRQNETESEENKVVDVDEKKIEEEIQSDDWLGHTLRFEESAPVLAKDASTKNDDWYDAYDHRNPLKKRKRGGEGRSANKKEIRSETSSTKRNR